MSGRGLAETFGLRADERTPERLAALCRLLVRVGVRFDWRDLATWEPLELASLERASLERAVESREDVLRGAFPHEYLSEVMDQAQARGVARVKAGKVASHG